jgi:LmbE family N-acetylglucosaminyl deacetylase
VPSMKLRIYRRPWIAATLLIATAGAWLMAALWSTSRVDTLLFVVAAFYMVLAAFAAWSLWRIRALERRCSWAPPCRLLILAPHEDDCTIAAGALGARNQRLGGETCVFYVVGDETPGMAEIRATEARAAWAIAGVGSGDLHHLPVLPPLRRRDPQQLRKAARALRKIIDDFRPDAVVVPMFEGGHVQHDMLAALMGVIVKPADRFAVFEAPEYGPYVSLNHTPHRIIALCTRWLFGLVSYYGPPDGIDSRPIETFLFDPVDLEIKGRMLACFTSQNAPSLVATRSYPDRLVRLNFERQWRQPFHYDRSYLRLALAARRVLPAALANVLLPTQLGTIGREGTLADWQQEWQPGPPGEHLA